MPRGRPKRGRVTIAVNVTPDTRLTLRRLAAEQDTTQGDIIDALIQKEIQMITPNTKRIMSLTSIEEIEREIRRWGQAFAGVCYTEGEIKIYHQPTANAGAGHATYHAGLPITEFSSWVQAKFGI